MNKLIEEISITELEQRVEFSCCGGVQPDVGCSQAIDGSYPECDAA